jgi:hypothetical protein
MILIWSSKVPGRAIVRRLTTPLGVQCWAEQAACKMGWLPGQDITYFDSDGLPLGGTVANKDRT